MFSFAGKVRLLGRYLEQQRLEKVLPADILYIEGMRYYRRIDTLSKKIMTLQTFRELEQELPDFQVCGVHKS